MLSLCQWAVEPLKHCVQSIDRTMELSTGRARVHSPEAVNPLGGAMPKLLAYLLETLGTCQLKLMAKAARDADFRELASVLIVLRHARG
jgi:hypothetical protein